MKPDYGIDAPSVIRNLSVAGGVAAGISLGVVAGVIPPDPTFEPAAGVVIRFPLLTSMVPAALALLGTACWMYVDSRFGKLRERERLLDFVPWRGDERVLDVGCGRGLLLVGAARRLTTGSAVGIDIWQTEDLSGNRQELPLENAERESVRDRVTVQTTDMRTLPFADSSFDVVVSRAAIHNLYAAADRAAAIREIARVLKPGGRAVIADIRHLTEYAQVFRAHGCPDVRFMGSRVASTFWMLLTMGSLRPNTLLVQKAS